MRMRLVVGGRELRGVQLGAVGCLPEQRGRGLMRQLLDRVLEEMTPQADLLMLFANEEVLDFYPRFGFRPVPESTFEVSLAARPATDPAPRLDLADAHERAAWLGARAVAPSPCERFGALDYGAIALWHATNFYSHCVRSLGEQGAWVVAQQKDDLLTVLDVAAVGAFDLVAAIPRLIDAPISRVRFGFSPERFFSQARASPDTESGLFVRGEVALPESALRFPALAQT
jgi:hypothetical protein